jgi:hypothetical protein
MRDGNIGTMMNEVATTARDVADATRETALLAGAYARDRAGVVSSRARDLAADAAEAVEDWTSGVHGAVRARPLYILAAAVGLGYLLGRVLRRD